jgi:hypothetical protein
MGEWKEVIPVPFGLVAVVVPHLYGGFYLRVRGSVFGIEVVPVAQMLHASVYSRSLESSSDRVCPKVPESPMARIALFAMDLHLQQVGEYGYSELRHSYVVTSLDS